MVLDTSLYKVLSWSFMGLIRSELYCFGIRIQKIVFHCLYKSKTNYIRINSLNIKKNYRSKTFTIRHLHQSDHLSAAILSLILLLQQYLLIAAICNNIITVATYAII